MIKSIRWFSKKICMMLCIGGLFSSCVNPDTFMELSPEEKQIVQLLQEKETVAIDEINFTTGLSSSTIAAAILNLELQSVIVSLPGKMYKLA